MDTYLYIGALALFLLYGFIHMVVEPVYMNIYKKPLYIHFYLFPKTLTRGERSVYLETIPFYKRLSDSRKKFFEHRVVRFLQEYKFHGKGGLIITDEVRILIAATYVMLTFGMRRYLIDTFDKIIVYPGSYQSVLNENLHNGEFNPTHKAVVFSWKHFRDGVRSDSDNINLGIHEFAHALHCFGMKKKDNSAALFAHMYERIMKEVKHPPNAKRLIESDYFRIYAYTNQYEFLAVILEHFFETPGDFKREFPELFENVRMMINYSESPNTLKSAHAF